MPTRGAQIAPARNVNEPIIAEAAPALFRSLSIASAVVEGKSIPRNMSIRKRKLSNQKKGISRKRLTAVAVVNNNKPELPVMMLCCGSLKRIDNAEPAAIPMEFTEKQRLKTSGEKP